MRLLFYSPELDEMLLATGTIDDGKGVEYHWHGTLSADADIEFILGTYDWHLVGFL